MRNIFKHLMNIFSHLKFKKAISLRFLNPSSQNTSSSLFPTATFCLSLLLKKSVMEFMTQTGIYNVEVHHVIIWNLFLEYRTVVASYVKLKKSKKCNRLRNIIMLTYDDYLMAILKMTPKWRKYLYVFDKSLFNIILFRNLHRV